MHSTVIKIVLLNWDVNRIESFADVDLLIFVLSYYIILSRCGSRGKRTEINGEDR